MESPTPKSEDPPVMGQNINTETRKRLEMNPQLIEVSLQPKNRRDVTVVVKGRTAKWYWQVTNGKQEGLKIS